MGLNKEKIIACGYVSVSFLFKHAFVNFPYVSKSYVSKSYVHHFVNQIHHQQTLTFLSPKNAFIFLLFPMNVFARQ